MTGAFDLLVQDLIDLDARRAQAHVQAPPPPIRALAKAVTRPVPTPARTAKREKPDWLGLRAMQKALQADMPRDATATKAQRLRTALADLRAAARAGRLSAHSAALVDIYTARAAALGLTP